MRPTDIRLPGAVDLSALKARQQQPASAPPGTGAAGSAAVVDVTEATFEAEVIERSRQVPVLLDFWAEWCGPCKQLSPVLERLAAEAGGAWVLAKVDVDANQRIAAAFQVQSIPTVYAVIAGQPVPLFQGALPEQQIRPVLDEVLRVAAENGLTGPAGDGGAAAGDAGVADGVGAGAAGPPLDPAYQAAQDALDRGDLDAAAAAYGAIVEQTPGDAVAQAALAQVSLLQRTRGVDEQAVRAAADAAPDDVDAQLGVADLDVVVGRVDEAIARLVALVRRTAGDDRDRTRQHLLGLFAALDPADPRLAKGRRDLANALY